MNKDLTFESMSTNNTQIKMPNNSISNMIGMMFDLYFIE